MKFKDILKEKKSVAIIIPILKDTLKYEDFLIEVFDLIEAYFNPLVNGLSKYAIMDFFESNETDLLSYIHKKRYIAEEKDFIDLFYKYTHRYSEQSVNKFKGYKVVINKNIDNKEDYVKSTLVNILNGTLINDVEEVDMPCIH